METSKIVRKLRIITIKIYAYSIIPIIIGGFFLVYFAMSPEVKETETVNFVTCVIIIITGPVVAIGFSRVKKLKEKRKELYNDALSTMIDYAYYEPERGFTDLEIGTFGIIKLGNVYNSENYFQGYYKGISVRQADVYIYNENYTDDNCNVTKYFDGRIYEFRTDKIAAQNVKVFSRGYDSRLSISDCRVDIDDFLFNDNYDVFSPEPSEAEEILTNEMIEHLLILQNKYKSIGFRFGEGKVCVAINGLKVFYGEHMNKVRYSKELAIMKEEVQVIKDLIEGLGLADKER